VEDAQLSDVGLVIGIGRRRVAALAEVYSRHGGPMYDVAARICGAEPAEEVVRTVLLDLWRAPGRYEPARSSLPGFLLQRAHAAAVELVRDGSAPSPVTLRPGSGRWTLDRRALATRTGNHAWSLLSTLDADERDTIALAYSCGYSSRDLEELLGEPGATVKERILTGLSRLRLGRDLVPRRG